MEGTAFCRYVALLFRVIRVEPEERLAAKLEPDSNMESSLGSISRSRKLHQCAVQIHGKKLLVSIGERKDFSMAAASPRDMVTCRLSIDFDLNRSKIEPFGWRSLP